MDFLPLAAPALPLDEAGRYVAGAYVVFLVLVVVYVSIMAAKLQRIEGELRELVGFAEHRVNGGAAAEHFELDEDSISVSLPQASAEEAPPDV
ncbi:MAG TPA: hypothetical protein VF093_03985 [Solirubrobacterales bacterium]